MSQFPIDALLARICSEVRPGQTVLLQAPPGAGKTTRVPLALIGAVNEGTSVFGHEKNIWMIEPRRLATKAAAARLAASLGEEVGARIGYAVRGEQKRSSRTQVEVITDGLFLRRLQRDPSLDGVGCVIFDEFHERGRDADLSLALLREARPLLNPDLAVILMSATLDLSDLKERLPEATVLESPGRCYPVDTHHQPPRPDEPLPKQVLRAIEEHALDQPRGSGVLVFLPGLAEIERCRQTLTAAPSLQNWKIQALHGQLPLQQQSSALHRCDPNQDGSIILASAIAESSLTIDGVRLVIDSGLSRQLRYDPNTRMEGLETTASSLASAEQRRGRAGRQCPGRCIRLWSPAEQQRRPPFHPPDLLLADPQPVLMELAQWGAGLGDDLPWLDPPPAAAMKEGQHGLQQLGLLKEDGRISERGRLISSLGVHPRLGMLLLEAHEQGAPQLGCDLAAILSERDPFDRRQIGSDLEARLNSIQRHPSLRTLSQQLRRQLKQLGTSPKERKAAVNAGDLILAAFPEWLAQQRPQQTGRYQLRQGRGATLLPWDPLQGSPALAVARVDMGGRDTRIQMAVALSQSTLESIAERDGHWQDEASWDPERQRVRAERLLQLGALVVRRTPQASPSAALCRTLLIEQLERHGNLDVLPWTDSSTQLRQRLAWMHQQVGPPWPDRDLTTLLKQADIWLGPSLEGCLGWSDISATVLEEALWGDLDWSLRQQLDGLLPRRIPIPSGRQAALLYTADEVILAVKLQEMFGSDNGPHVLHGRIPVTLELLSPAGRPLQRTRDLKGFWQGSYQEVRREMRGRYPKHPWPDDPRQALPTARTKRRSSGQQP
ncbi:DEAD/DEAH box helicase [Synechococcus sp. KORDI-52]|uniref:ATP-dependent helicase HrpB n=1 Tax=Synechococcus sp. KORDI-52 TaxID=585425 RepID=UPI0004E09AAC|nr:ATP-dependent helicase HrpB [Synechococcus sp. KORDI-52]AII48417.1 DEAD/DEAH box helicase [Synechococcus sp. KORDI-52]